MCAKRRVLRIRGRLKKGTASVPRISVFRSLKHIYVQMINDIDGKTVVSSSSLIVEKSTDKDKKGVARSVGLDLAKRAKERGIETAFFDRGEYRYLGRAKELAEGVREGGVQF
jgi:large subunit ribosomal protein L18